MKEPYLILEEEVALWADIFPATAITVRSRPHAPAPTPEQCEKRNCLECPLWDKCSVMEYMPMCSRATYDGVRKNAARAATLAAQARFVSGRESNGRGGVYTRPDEPSFIVGVIIGKKYYSLNASIFGTITAKEIPMPEYYDEDKLRQQAGERR
jgi:hypothetical protein